MDSILQFELLTLGKVVVTPARILAAIVIFLIARLLIFIVIHKIVGKILIRRKVDVGRRFAINSFIKYILYFITIVFILQSFGAELSALLLGSAGLLVGVGLGLQQTFNDFISGIIMLIEGDVAVGDVLEIDGVVGRVNKIGLRTSDVRTRDNITIIVPNHKLVGNNVINWTHTEGPARFTIDIGVHYNSDIDKAELLLLHSATKHAEVLKDPPPLVQLRNFGDSSIDFKLFFYSYEFFNIERTKSDLRKIIFKDLTAAGIEIPYPQRDLWIKNEALPDLKPKKQEEKKG